MSGRQPGRPTSLAALLRTALAMGAFAGLVAASFIWVVERGVELLWSDLPERVGVDPFGSWWLFAIPLVGGALVGMGQRFLGNDPPPLEEAMATWKAGGHIEPEVAPKTAVNSLVALVAGGPVHWDRGQAARSVAASGIGPSIPVDVTSASSPRQGADARSSDRQRGPSRRGTMAP